MFSITIVIIQIDINTLTLYTSLYFIVMCLIHNFKSIIDEHNVHTKKLSNR